MRYFDIEPIIMKYRPSGLVNAFGDLLIYEKKYHKWFPIICQHGGSNWFCRECAENVFNKVVNLKKPNGQMAANN